jgi:hypothetical protein
MAEFSLPTSPHKINRDGTLNSICMRCFKAIAAHKRETEIEEIERAHVCQSSPLSERGVRASLSSSR